MDHTLIKQQLIASRAELESRLERTHKHIFHKDAPVSANFHEQVVETGNDQLVQSLELEAQAEIRQIDRALQRLENGEYEQCSRCGDAIGEARLKAIPYAQTCIVCAESD